MQRMNQLFNWYSSSWGGGGGELLGLSDVHLCSCQHQLQSSSTMKIMLPAIYWTCNILRRTKLSSYKTSLSSITILLCVEPYFLRLLLQSDGTHLHTVQKICSLTFSGCLKRCWTKKSESHGRWLGLQTEASISVQIISFWINTKPLEHACARMFFMLWPQIRPPLILT